jgi:hypothetical protein
MAAEFGITNVKEDTGQQLKQAGYVPTAMKTFSFIFQNLVFFSPYATEKQAVLNIESKVDSFLVVSRNTYYRYVIKFFCLHSLNN